MQLKLFNLVIDDKKHKRFIVEKIDGSRQLVYYDDDGKIKKLVGYRYQGRTIKNLNAREFVLSNAEFHNIKNEMNHPVNTRLPMVIQKQKHHLNIFTKYEDVQFLDKCLDNLKKQGWSIKLCDTGFYQFIDFYN